MKVAIIGGTGFVGSYITDELIKNDHTPRLLVREGSDYKVLQPDKCEIVQGNIDNNDAIKEPINRWRPYAFLLFSNFINDVYQSVPFSLEKDFSK